MSAVFFPRDGGSNEEALFRGCMPWGAKWVSKLWSDGQTSSMRFFKRNQSPCYHDVLLSYWDGFVYDLL